MKDLKTVMLFTMKEMAKRKSFIISTLIIMILIVIGFNVPNFIQSISGDENIGEKVLISDKENVFEGSLEALKENKESNYNIELENLSFDEIKQKIDNGDIDSAILVEKSESNIKMRYIVKTADMMTTIPEDLINSINGVYSNLQIGKLGLTKEQLESITPNFEYNIEQTDEEEVQGNIFVMMMLSIVLFYGIYFCAYQVSSSITTEKTSKIMETLVTSTSPRTIVLGKTIGIGLVGLAQLLLIAGTALISAKAFLDPNLLSTVLDISTITSYVGIVVILYFILGYLTYSLLYALTGSTVSKPEDIQSANSPIALLAAVGFYLSYFTMMQPTSKLNVFAAMFPISSPFCMPFRVMMGLASGVDVLISILILIATIIIVAKVAIKIYSNAILNYGTKMSFKDILNMYKSK